MARSSRRRRSSERAERKQNMLGLGLAILGVVGLSGMAYAMWWADAGRVRLDAANCPVSGPAGIHAVLIDRSDPISPLQAQRVRQEFDRMVLGARAGERFDLYVGEGDGVNVLAPSVSLCSPGRGEDANGLYQNPVLIQRAFEERFVAPLQEGAARLLEPAARTTSPILESLRAVAVSSFGGLAGSRRTELRLTIVSDLVQHSALNSHFRGETEFSDLERRPQWQSLRTNLSGVNVSVMYLLRPNARRTNGTAVQNRGHQLFWERAIRANGGELVALEAL